jgi:hypothetical protein
MDYLPELVTNTIWRYYWENIKKGFLNDIKNRNHKLLINNNFDVINYIYLDPDERRLFLNF